MINETTYLTVADLVRDILSDQGFEFDRAVKRLEFIISDGFGSLNTSTNPAISNLENWSEEDIRFLVREYSAFSNESIHMFHDASIRLVWDNVKREVARNVAEEMGELTGMPHLEMMRQGYREDLGVETDDVVPSAVTRGFLKRMRSAFQTSDSAFLSGALLAFEATATSEFKGVEQILRTLKRRQGGELDPDTLTGRYIAGHVVAASDGENPEDDHYRGMRDAIGANINDGNADRFVRGFIAVCTALNSWWEQLSIEVYSQRLQLEIMHDRYATQGQHAG